ncbi:MAG: cytochrome c3 family protein [Nitrospirota bacterium]|nr:cytochrome c3 family protein [Nitrospirota bacterium]
MKRAIVGTLLFLAIAGSLWSSLRTGVHDFTGDRCGDCHAVAPVKGDPRAAIMKAPISELCGRCHRREDTILSHPVEMIPLDAVVPRDLPLSWDGKMTCSTCHDMHATAPLAGEGLRRLLRRPVDGRAFCEVCHNHGVLASQDGARHSQRLAAAHLRTSGRQNVRTDRVSSFCMECHDGTTGQLVAVKNGSCRRVSGADSPQDRSHPVGINYRAAMAKRGGLHAPEEIVAKIKLVNGRVSCISCHDLYSRNSKLLAATPTNLCTTCHDK